MNHFKLILIFGSQILFASEGSKNLSKEKINLNLDNESLRIMTIQDRTISSKISENVYNLGSNPNISIDVQITIEVTGEKVKIISIIQK